MKSEYGPEFDAFAKRCREELVPKIEGSGIFVSITPSSPEKVDIKFAVELGLAIMYDKPICAVISPGSKISEKLSRVVDKFVEMDFNDPSQKTRLTDALDEMMAEKEKEES